jgi:hypothetical protein
MKKAIILFIIILGWMNVSAQTLQPYTMGVELDVDMPDVIEQTISSLNQHELEVVGQYMPANDKNRWIIVVTHPELLKASELIGGLAGFAATLRVGITRENEKTNVSYTNPVYWGNAYYRDEFSKVEGHYTKVEQAFKNAMNGLGDFKGDGFGSEKGVTVEKLRKYHYMFGMPYFEDVEDLEDFDSHGVAVKEIDARLNKGVPNVKLVYKVEIPNSKLTLYGLALSGEDGEAKFLPTIDITEPKHTAFLPYEMLVNDKEVVMLHGRFRIALSFPDLTMGTFTKIMSTPGDIEDMLEQLVVEEED